MELVVFVTFGITVLVIFISRNVYSVHQMRRILNWVPEVPGVPILGNVLQLSQSTVSLKQFSNFLHQYSGLCRLNFVYSTSLLSSDPKMLEFVLSSNKILNKSTEYRFLENWLGWGLLIAPIGRWRKNRKIITPAFHFSILEQFVEVFERNGKIMVEQLKDEVGKVVNIYPFVAMCALDAICEAAMGVSINAQKNHHSEYVFSVKEMCRIIIDRSFSIKRYDFINAFSKDYYKEKKYVKILHGMTTTVIKSRKEEFKREAEGQEIFDSEKSPKKLAFLDLLLKAQMEGKDMPDEAIREEVDTFMFEGHDTTTSAICFTLYCLANNPEYQALAFEEQKALFGNDKNRKVLFRDLQEMKFLDLVIKETLRLYPSVPFFGRYFDQDIEYGDGRIIPKGVNIIIVAFEANRNPVVFENPNVFNPYRFDTSESKQWHYSYIPFSAGPRNCIGQKFAVLEMKSMVSKILRDYVIHSGGPENDVILIAESVLSSKNGVKLKLTPREW